MTFKSLSGILTESTKLLEALRNQQYWILALVLGVLLVLLPCIRIDKDAYWAVQSPVALWPVIVGTGLVAVSGAAFAFSPFFPSTASSGAGLDLTPVREADGTFSTKVGECEIRVVLGRIEDYKIEEHTAFVLPCDEYFDCCVDDSRTALGSFVRSRFEGQANALDRLIKRQCSTNLGPGSREQKTGTEQANSFGAGHCIFLSNPLGRSLHLALISTAIQRAPRGPVGRFSYIFAGIRELARSLAQGRIRSVVMPVLGAGHAGVNPALALVGLLLALAEMAYYAEPGERLRSATIVVYKKDGSTAPQVDPVVIRRALALVARD